MNKIASFFICCLFALTTGCNKKNENQLKVAASPVPHAQLLKEIQPDLKTQGIDLKIIEVDDYQIPNRSLAEKEVDANFFQHIPFLEQQKTDFHYPLVCFAKIHLEPMGLYSKKITKLDELKERDLVALPNDPTNEFRALTLLQDAKLITLSSNAQPEKATVADIEDNPMQLRFKEVDAALLPRTLDDVTLAAIPTNFALQADLDPKNALELESAHSPYVNILAIRAGDENNEKLIALKKAMLSEKMRQYIETKYKGAIIPVLSECNE
ncbi:MAG TPA: MetQ/NlpA family ABC transporter substrate-binding protein [Rhabdochlamydiaceae bacterium]|nr:MetQ/NlpA family ABC transporter substrate-binding protein [Rhabdochlamydiaceae bacterium]